MDWDMCSMAHIPQGRAKQGCGAAVPYGQHHPSAGPGLLQARGSLLGWGLFPLPTALPSSQTQTQPSPEQPQFWEVCMWPHSPKVKGLRANCSSPCFNPGLLVMPWQRTLYSDLLIEI